MERRLPDSSSPEKDVRNTYPIGAATRSTVCGKAFILFALCLALSACSDDTESDTGQAPEPNAGADQTVPKRAIVRLDASASTDADSENLTYSWSQRSGPTIALASSNGATTTFTAPAEEGEIVMEVSVSDGKNNASDTVVI